MGPTAIKTLMTFGAGACGAACFLPHAEPYRPFLTAMSGLLMGAAHIQQPATTDQMVKRAADAVAKEER